MTGTQAPDLPTTAGPAVTDPTLVPLPLARPRSPDVVRGKLFIKTHGCQMNEYDSAKMADVLAASDGLELTDNPEEADVVLVNTCSIREKAQEKVFSQLGRWKALKNGGRDVIIGVGGCVASQEGEAIVKRAVVVEGPDGDSIAIRPMMNLCLSFDHRALDGAEAARFLAAVKARLEQWSDDG